MKTTGELQRTGRGVAASWKRTSEWLTTRIQELLPHLLDAYYFETPMKHIPPFRLVPEPLNEEAAKLPPYKWAGNDIGKRHRIGGKPDVITLENYPTCECGRTMTFYGQLDSLNDEYNLADCGIIHVFVPLQATLAGTSEAGVARRFFELSPPQPLASTTAGPTDYGLLRLLRLADGTLALARQVQDAVHITPIKLGQLPS